MIVNAKAMDGTGGINHVRLLTLSPRGAMIQDESYYEGLQARATGFTEGWNGERVITAIIEDDATAVNIAPTTLARMAENTI